MRPRSVVHVAILTLLVLLLCGTASAQIFFGPRPYLSVADLPAGFYTGGAPDFLENFEDLSLGGGITASSGQAARGTFGVHHAGGISRIRIIDTGRNFEVDHVQYGAAPVPPNAPLDLTATVVGSSVSLAWQPPPTGTAPSFYILEAALSAGGAPIASLPVAGTALTVASVTHGVYYVRVGSVSPGGTSGPSNEVVVVVPAPGAGCTTAPTSFMATASGSLVTLTWSSPVACPATAYVVQAGSAPGLTDIAEVNVGGVTSVSAFALAGRYDIRVIALNSFGISTPTVEAVLTVGTP